MRRKIKQKLWPAFTAVAVGMTLVFVLFSSSHFPRRAAEGAVGLGLVLLGASQWRRASRHMDERPAEEVVDVATVVVDAEGSAEIVLGPEIPVVNPKLYLTAHGRPVVVEDAWHEEVSVLSCPRSIAYWHHGVVYPGVLSDKRTLRILLRNEGFAPATVRARVTTTKKAEE